MHVPPLAQPQVVHERLPAAVDLSAVRELLAGERLEELPEVDERQEVRALVAEAQVRLVRRLRLLEGPLARVGHRERARDHQRLREAAALARRQHDPTDPRVERQLRELAADRRERAALVDRAQLGEELVAVGDRPRRRRLDERERVDRPELERGHLQDHARERAPQDLRLREPRARLVVGLGVEPHADAVAHAPAAPGALVGVRPRDLLDLEQRGLVARRVALDAREPGVDHVPDAGHRERGLRDVGREHDAPAARGRERALLLLGREPGVERDDLRGRAPGTAPQVGAQEVGGLADLALAGQEREDVAGALAPQVGGRVDDRLLDVLLVVGRLVVRVAARRAVAHLDRVEPSRHLDHRRGRALARAEVTGEALGVERGRRDHDLEVVAAREELPEIPEQEVDVEAALVRLVDDDRVVGEERAVAARLGEQDAVGHELHPRARRGAVGEADLVADGAAERHRHFLGDPRRHRARGEAPRLRVPDQPALAAAGGDADLRELRRLARAGLAAHDHDRVRADRRGDLAGALRHRQVGRIRELRARRDPLGVAPDRARDVGREPPPRLLGSASRARFADSRLESRGVRGERVGEAPQERLGGGRWHSGGRRGAAGRGFYRATATATPPL